MSCLLSKLLNYFYLLFQAFKNANRSSLVLDECDDNQDTDVDEGDPGTDIDIIDDTEEITSVDVFEALQLRDKNEDKIKLPKHFRCSAHIMSILGDVHLHKIKITGWNHTQMNTWERIWSKLQAIWTRQSKSPSAANKIREILGKLLKRPSLTRWNSILDAVEDISIALKDQEIKKKLKEAIESFKETKSKKAFKFFTDNEIYMMNAYVNVFKPLAIALDTIQGEAMIYGGMLLPTIAILEGNLHTVQNDEDLKCMKPIVTHIWRNVASHNSYTGRISPYSTE